MQIYNESHESRERFSSPEERINGLHNISQYMTVYSHVTPCVVELCYNRSIELFYVVLRHKHISSTFFRPKLQREDITFLSMIYVDVIQKEDERLWSNEYKGKKFKKRTILDPDFQRCIVRKSAIFGPIELNFCKCKADTSK